MNKYQKAIHQMCNRGKSKRGIYKVLKRIYGGMARKCNLDLYQLIEFKNLRKNYIKNEEK